MSEHSHALHREMEAAKVLKAHLRELVGDDEEALRDTIEGETRLQELIALVMEEVGADAAAVEGIKLHIDKLETRCHRLKERIGHKKQAILAAMAMAEVKKLELPLCTLSRQRTAPSVQVIDETQIPSKFWKRADPSLDKKAIMAALKDKEIIPGAVLSNGGETLAVRV